MRSVSSPQEDNHNKEKVIDYTSVICLRLKKASFFINMSTIENVLKNGYTEPTRPISSRELNTIREQLNKKLRLGNVIAKHKRCKHWYRVSTNGRKEKQIKDEENADSGNCSVCWKLKTTNKEVLKSVHGLVNEYMNLWNNQDTTLTHYLVDLESVFYRWLYEDNK